MLWEGKVVTEARCKAADAAGADGDGKELGTVKPKPNAAATNEIAAKPTGLANGAAPAAAAVDDAATKRQQAMDAGDGNLSPGDLTAFYSKY